MKRIAYSALLLLLTLGISACGDKSGTTTTNGSDSTATSPTKEDIWLQVQYDDLRLRSAAGMKSEVLATLKAGDQVQDLGEWSKETETVELRKQRITAPWGKVKTKDGKEGWLFMGALVPVMDPIVKELESEIEVLPLTDCGSIDKALQLYSAKMKGKSQWVADQGVPALEQFVFQVVDKINIDALEGPDADVYANLMDDQGNPKQGTKVQPQLDAWKACGLHLEFPEGMIMIAADAGRINAAVEPLGTEAMKKYLAQRKKEVAEGWSEDAGLMITPMNLAERAVFWDQFLVQYPTFVNAPAMRSLAFNYTTDLLLGLDNTPSVAYEGKLNDDFKAAYEWVLSNHANSETAHWVKEWYDLIKASGYKRSAKTDAFATKLFNP